MATRTIRTVILRALTDSSAATIPDDAIWQMFVSGPAGNPSLLEYWSQVTDGYLVGPSPVMLPWVTLPAGGPPRGRDVQWDQAIAEYNKLPGNVLADLDSYDCKILLCTPAVGFDAGANGLSSYCVLNPNAVFTFYLHEFGHVLGFAHTHGLPNLADSNPGGIAEYGDPFDIMSARAFASLQTGPTQYVGNPTFSTDATITGWPLNQNTSADDCKTSQGPEPVRASIHLWDPRACPTGTVSEFSLPPGGLASPIRATLSAAAFHDGLSRGGSSLIILHPPGEQPATGEGRIYIEYRYPTGWDRGLHTSDPGGDPASEPELARQAVVVHSAKYSPVVSPNNNDNVYCTYEGQIIVPLEKITDLTVHPPLRGIDNATDVVIRVLGENPVEFEGTVDIEIAAATSRQRNAQLEVLPGAAPEWEVLEELQVPPGAEYDKCGDKLEWETASVNTLMTYSVQTTGYGAGNNDPTCTSPRITWSVNGSALPSQSGYVAAHASDGLEHTLRYTIHPHAGSLELVDEAEGSFTGVIVTATVTDDAGQNPIVLDSDYGARGTELMLTAESTATAFACYVKRHPHHIGTGVSAAALDEILSSPGGIRAAIRGALPLR
jgi:hypothetical protein